MLYVLVHRNQPLLCALINSGLLFPSGEPGRWLDILISEIIHAGNVPPNHFFSFFKWKKWGICQEQDGEILHRAAAWRWEVKGIIFIAAYWDWELWCCVVAGLALCQGLFKHGKQRWWQPQSVWIFPYEPGPPAVELQRKEGGGNWRRDKDNYMVNIPLTESLLESWDVCWTSKVIGKILRYGELLPDQWEKAAYNCVGVGNTTPR